MAFIFHKTPLAANEEVVVGTIQAGPADGISGAVFSDQAGTIYIEQSGDGTNWDLSTNYAITANTGRGFSESIYLPNVRIRYKNGAVAQTSFRLYARTTSAGPR